MKIRNTIVSTAVALTILLASTSAVFAQSVSADEWEWGTGIAIDASLDAYMIPAAAEALGMSAEDVAAQYEAGSTFAAIALAQGILPGEIDELLQSVHANAIDMAVADGVLSQEQAEWLQQVQFGGNARVNKSGSWTGTMNPGMGQRQNPTNLLRQNAASGSAMGRGGRR